MKDDQHKTDEARLCSELHPFRDRDCEERAPTAAKNSDHCAILKAVT